MFCKLNICTYKVLTIYFHRFTGGEINHCYNSIDRHVDEGRGDQVAIIHESPVTNSMTKITYNQLLNDVNNFLY